jgi:hypothetical protein
MFYMETASGVKYTWLIYLFLLILVGGADGNASGMIGAWEPFKAQKELETYVSGVNSDMIPSSRDELVQMDKIISIYGEPADRKEGISLNTLRFHNVTISFSRVLMDQMKVDIRQQTGNESEKLNTIKSLPSMFVNSPYRDTFESLGKIFEPQVNLSIEF